MWFNCKAFIFVASFLNMPAHPSSLLAYLVLNMKFLVENFVICDYLKKSNFCQYDALKWSHSGFFNCHQACLHNQFKTSNSDNAMYILWDNIPEYSYWGTVPFLSFISSLHMVNTRGREEWENNSKNTKNEHDFQCNWIISYRSSFLPLTEKKTHKFLWRLCVWKGKQRCGML